MCRGGKVERGEGGEGEGGGMCRGGVVERGEGRKG